MNPQTKAARDARGRMETHRELASVFRSQRHCARDIPSCRTGAASAYARHGHAGTSDARPDETARHKESIADQEGGACQESRAGNEGNPGEEEAETYCGGSAANHADR